MTYMELIVRPFQTRDVTPPTIIPQEPREPTLPILLMGSEDSTTFKLDAAMTTNVQFVTGRDYQEVNRKSDVETVHNPDDEGQKVDVERIRQSEYKDRNANPMRPQMGDTMNIEHKPFTQAK